MQPVSNNHRDYAVKIFDMYKEHDAWYGLEQEYFIYDNETNLPLYPGVKYDDLTPHTKYYCSVGENAYKVRNLMETHMDYCLDIGIKMSGYNQEVAPGQGEFQIGPEEGLKVCDDLWVARFILQKLSEYFNVKIVYHPKPIKENCNGSGCHTNFSTINTRNEGGYDYILKCMNKLEIMHEQHINVYGDDNHLRLTGTNETSSMSKFTWSVGGRDVSVRIGFDTFNDKCGYFEDRRCASNINPYQVCPLILQTCVE
jgi:glutamine synthetase